MVRVVIHPVNLATEATADDIKTAVEALVVATPDTADGDLADINAASASIDGKLPALVGGKIPVDASVSIDPAGLATEATADDIKTAVEALVVATPDTAAGDLADINAATASIDGKLPALVGGKIPVDASVSIDPAGLATEATAGNIETATEALAALISSGALKVSMATLPDTSTGSLFNMAIDINTMQSDIAAAKSDIGTMKTDIATAKADISAMKADIAAIRAILES